MSTNEKIWSVEKKSGAIQLRSGVVQAFFLPTPFVNVVNGILIAFERYLRRIPAGALHWRSIGASSEEWRPFDKHTIHRCLDQLDAEAARERPLSYFELRDGDTADDAPGYSVSVIGQPEDPEFPEERNLLQFVYPSDVLRPEGIESFVQETLVCAELLPFVSGYASPALFCSNEDAWRAARAPAKRYPGFDLHDNINTRLEINGLVRGARWLTLLGPDQVVSLGGEASIIKCLPDTVVVLPAGAGLMARVSPLPELYDTRAKTDMTAMKALAELLEPITLFEESALYCTEFIAQDDDRLRSWERRFLDA